MRFELKDFQIDAVEDLYRSLSKMRSIRGSAGMDSSVCLSAPTGSGKTVICAAVIEALFFGNTELGLEADPDACVLWLSGSPDLNQQTRARFVQASDALADWIGDERHLETITNTFCGSHETLDPGHVYFLSKGLLASGNHLVRGSELNNGRVFWDVLDRTVRDPDRNLYLFIDEAHRGLGTKSKDNLSPTIYAQLIDGVEGRQPVPFVIGVTATPKNFQDAMDSRPDRVSMPPIMVSPKDVQESGLLKDTIELRVPEKDDSVEHQYLSLACERFELAERHWRDYCERESLDAVTPLLIVQVKDKISDEELEELCCQIDGRVTDLDLASSFANVFGEHADLKCGRYFIPYISPELVENQRQIRVLFAKEAISNGWDCPRAEVIYSQRRRSQPTYIAQLIGRMVRTPLARRIDSDELLSSVACYLPYFDPESTQSVVDYLTGKDDALESGGVSVGKVILNPVYVQPADPRSESDYEAEMTAYEDAMAEAERAAKSQPGYQLSFSDEEEQAPYPASKRALSEAPTTSSSTGEAEEITIPGNGEPSRRDDGRATAPEAPATVKPATPSGRPAPIPVPKPPTKRDGSFTHEEWEGVRAAFDTIVVLRNPKKARNEFRDLLDTASLMAETGLEREAPNRINARFCAALAGQIIEHGDEYSSARHEIEVAETRVITIDKLNDNGVYERTEEVQADEEGVALAAHEADKDFGGPELPNAYRKRIILDEGLDTYEAYEANLYEANLRLASVVHSDSILEYLRDWAARERRKLFDKYSSERSFLSEEDRQRYDALERETEGRRIKHLQWPSSKPMDGKLPRWPKHILQAEDGMCPLKLNSSETIVLERELAHSRTVAFYRNPSNYSPESFSIPFTMPNGRVALHPDFIFFIRDDAGKIWPSIVDPHGVFLSDTLPRLKGYIEYLHECPGIFKQVLSIGVFDDDQMRSLDLLRADVQERILNFKGDTAEELYLDPKISNLYYPLPRDYHWENG